MKMMKWNNKIVAYLLMTAGAFLTACGTVLFMVPNNIAPSGFTGVSSIFHYLTDFPIGTFVFILNLPFFVFAYREYGRLFFVRTLYSLALYSLFSDILPQFSLVDEPILACIFGGVLYGVGVGLVLYGGGTTGGTELLAKLILKKANMMSIGSTMFIIDALILGAACFVFGVQNTLYAVIALFISTKVIDTITGGPFTGKAYYIFSGKNEQIYNRIMHELSRGGTYFFAEGAYSKKQEKVLLCIIHGRIEAMRLKNIISETDKDAFVMTVTSSEITGQGFGQKNDSLH
jgi:uncharacterized membrane-anchored protein YitT (DUF2179 family)